MAAPRKYTYDDDELVRDAPLHTSIAQLAKAKGIVPNSLVHYLQRNAELDRRVRGALGKPPPRAPKQMETPGMTVKEDGEVTVIGEPLRGELSQVKDAEQWLRARWGFPDKSWLITSCTGNSWEGPGGGQPGVPGLVTYSQVKGTFRKIADLGFLSPATHVPKLVRTKSVRRTTNTPQTWVCEYDHQAPYYDEKLDAAATAMHQDLQPDGQFFGGDLMDLPSISAHKDHPSAKATPQECVNSGYHVLRRRAEASPDARRVKIRGNHDWRIEGEQLARAERLHGLAPADDTVPALALKRLLHADTLGLELIEDPRGWQHDEFEIVPGPHGLVARHGWYTGANTAEKSMKKRGRSILVGHTHQPEHHWWWDPSMEIHRQGVVVGAMCLSRNIRFPHFAPLDNWTQGPAIVTIHPNGQFVIEQTNWFEGRLYWRDRSWKP